MGFGKEVLKFVFGLPSSESSSDDERPQHPRSSKRPKHPHPTPAGQNSGYNPFQHSPLNPNQPGLQGYPHYPTMGGHQDAEKQRIQWLEWRIADLTKKKFETINQKAQGRDWRSHYQNHQKRPSRQGDNSRLFFGNYVGAPKWTSIDAEDLKALKKELQYRKNLLKKRKKDQGSSAYHPYRQGRT